MRMLVDADASGHRDLLITLARENDAELVWVHNPSQKQVYAEPDLKLTVILADSASQAVDMVIMNLAGPGDLVVTPDVGLASVCVAKGAAAISPRGFWYRQEDMMQRMEWRALAAELRRGGVSFDKKPPKTRLDDWRLEQELRRALKGD